MFQDNSPQLGGLPEDNAPMISGRGTKIIVSARGAYEARNLPALFDAMDADQQVLFRQAVIIEMMGRIRMDIEQAAETRPEMLETLTRLAQWVFEPTQENTDRLYATYLDDRLGQLDPLTYRLRALVLAASYDRHNAIGYAKDAILYVADDDIPHQPHYTIMESELEDWIFEVGWAILHGRNAPPLHLDAARIESLIGDMRYWIRKGNLPLLYELMTADQQEQFIRAFQRQAVWFIDRVPVDRWSADDLELIERTHKWVASASSPNDDEMSRLQKRYFGDEIWIRNGYSYADPSRRALVQLLSAFWNAAVHGLEGGANGFAIDVINNVMLIVEPDQRRETVASALQWQLDAAHAILTDQPIPAL